ncbi:MAG: ABC transporter permease [bacterium]
MTTATLTRIEAPRQAGFRRTVGAEWTKLRTVRSTAWTLAAMVLVSVGLTALVAMLAAPDLAESMAAGEPFEPVGAFATWGLSFGQIAALVLGVLVGSAEYTTGLIRATLAAAPRRLQVLGAKAVVLAGVMLVLGTATTVASFLAGNYFLDREGIGLAIGDEGVLRAMFGGGLYLAVLALFGLALGLLVRHTAGAVTVGLGLIFVAGNLVMLIPGTVGEWLTKLMPGNAGSTIATVEHFNPMLLGPWAGFAVFTAETVALLVAAGWLFSRRDA